MKSDAVFGLLLVAGLLAGAWVLRPAPPAPTPEPAPAPVPIPPLKPKPWGPGTVLVSTHECPSDYTAGAIVLGGPVSPDGKVEVQADLAVDVRTENCGGSDGAGLCVFSSGGHSARFQNVPLLVNFRDFMRSYPGGGYPTKVDKYIALAASKAGLPAPVYANYEGKDLNVLRAALASGRMPAVTYNGHDPHYKGSISHMVNLVALTGDWACVLDNNFIGANELVWMTPEQFSARWCGGGNGWALLFFAPAPPPVPHN